MQRHIGGCRVLAGSACKGGYRVLPFRQRGTTSPVPIGSGWRVGTGFASFPVLVLAPRNFFGGRAVSDMFNEFSGVPACSPCFTPGTLIATDRGHVPVETLARGDRIVTRDNGLKRIQWVGRRILSHSDLRLEPELTPILVRAHAFGEGRPNRDMMVSPNHRFLVGGSYSPIALETEEALIAARHLVNQETVIKVSALGVSYLHLLCNQHEVILADGAWTESFHPDDVVMRALGAAQRKELLDLFPEISVIGASRRFKPARRILDDRSRFDA